MKKMRKGFTLVELLIVIAVIGILATMTLLGGQEATNIAKAARITDEFDKISSIMMTYYADNYAKADAGQTQATDILTAVQARIKDADKDLVVAEDPQVGKYSISIEAGDGSTTSDTWWLTYMLEGANTKVGAILMSKNTRFGFKKATTGATNTDYDGKQTICMKVR